MSWGPILKSAKVTSLSQEHGVITFLSASVMFHVYSFLMLKEFDLVDLGATVFIIPVHSCLVVNLLRRYIELSTGASILTLEASLPEDS